MSYRGQFKQGVVIFDTPPPLREGAVVEVAPVDQPPASGPDQRELPAWGEVLKDFIGKAKGLPADMARNHDHYIHGARKR
jgi:hypothetical protein